MKRKNIAAGSTPADIERSAMERARRLADRLNTMAGPHFIPAPLRDGEKPGYMPAPAYVHALAAALQEAELAGYLRAAGADLKELA